MTRLIRCARCNKQIQLQCEGFDGKGMFISLNIQRFHDMCKECHHMKEIGYQQYFCDTNCLKEWINNSLDNYMKERVFWDKK